MKIIRVFMLFGALVSVWSGCTEEEAPPTGGGSNDTIKPSVVADLDATTPNANSVVLEWTAPGDDDAIGKARLYDIRFWTALITPANFDSASTVSNEPAPKVGGSSEVFTVTGLQSNQKYYFALRAADEAFNWSDISNVDSATTLLAGAWTIYNTSNSDIPTNVIYDIAFSGAIKYFATDSGLVAFDNTDWTVYDTVSSEIADNNLSAVLVDAAGTVWVGTRDQGLSRLSAGAFMNFNNGNSGLASNAITSLTSQIAGNVWIGSANLGIFSFVYNTTWTNYNSANSDLFFNGINKVALDPSGDLWIGYNIGGIGRFDGLNFVRYTSADGFPSDVVWVIFPKAANQIWCGTNHGAAVFNGSTWMTFNTANSGILDDVIISIGEDNTGNLWFGTRFGVSRFDGANWTNYTTANSELPNDHIWVIKRDFLGNLYFGTNGGVAILSP